MKAARKSLDLFTNTWLQKLVSAGAALICAITVMTMPSFLYSSEERNEEIRTVVPPTAYETHLPKEIYEVCIKQHLLETDGYVNISEQQNSDGAHLLLIRFKDEEEQYITITYFSERMLNNMKGIQIAYREGALYGYVFFDEQGNEHVFRRPFSDEQVTDVADFILDKIFPVFP